MKIVFSRHAEEKFGILEHHGWEIERTAVEEAVRNPSVLDRSRTPLMVAQIPLDETHVLRVVYKQRGDELFIITFYPGRTNQYGNQKKSPSI